MAHSTCSARRWHGAAAAAVAGLMLCGSLSAVPAALADSSPSIFQQALSARQSAEPSAPETAAVPEVKQDLRTAQAVAEMCGALEFEGQDASVDKADQLQVFVKDGVVWVVQRGECGVAKPEASESQASAESQAQTSAPRFDIQKLERSGLAVMRAYLLFGELGEEELVDGEFDSTKPVAADEGTASDEAEGAQFVSLTWVVVDKDDKPVCAFVLGGGPGAEKPADDVVPAEPSRLEALLAETEVPEAAKGIMPEYRLQTAAFYEAEGWWVSHPEFDASAIMADWQYDRVHGEVPELPDGRKVDDPTFSVKVVDEAAADTQAYVVDDPSHEDWRWVVDKAAWSESQWVDTSHYEDVLGWYCPSCGTDFGDWDSAIGHFDYWDYIDTNNYLWQNGSGEWICVWCDLNFGADPDSYSFGLMHMYGVHTLAHQPADTVVGQTWVESGYTEVVDHPEEGHWESYMTEEQGHWENAHVDEKSHWDTQKLGKVEMK